MSTNKIKKRIFLDTTALISLITPTYKSHDKIVAYLKNEDALLCFDTVVLSEVLAGMKTDSERDAMRRRCLSQFEVAVYDSRCATVCADVFAHLKAKGQVPRGGAERQFTKVDVMILASAIISRVDEFLHEDKFFDQVTNLLSDSNYSEKLPSFKRLSMLQLQMVQAEIPGLAVDC